MAGVEEVTATDLAGDNRGAAALTLSGASADGLRRRRRGRRPRRGDRTGNRLADRFDAAADAEVAPLLPVVLGLVAAALAAAGTLARARRYR